MKNYLQNKIKKQEKIKIDISKIYSLLYEDEYDDNEDYYGADIVVTDKYFETKKAKIINLSDYLRNARLKKQREISF